MDFKETAFNYIVGDKYGTFFTSERKYINKINKWIESGEDVKIEKVNIDGSIVCKVPKEWLNIRPKKKLSEDHLQKLRERMKKVGEDNAE